MKSLFFIDKSTFSLLLIPAIAIWFLVACTFQSILFASDNGTNLDKSIQLIRPEISIPVFALLRRVDPKLELAVIDSKITSEVKSGKTELEAIYSVSKELGVPVAESLIPSNQPELIPVPSLLIISSTGKPGFGGVLVLVEAKSDDYLQVYDVQGGRGRGYLHNGDLGLTWNGEAIVLDSSEAQSTMYGIGAALVLISFGFVLALFFRSQHKIVICAVLVLVVCGCTERSPKKAKSTTWPISTPDGSIAELGMLHGDDMNAVDFSIPLVVNHSGELTIISVLGNCSCLSVGEDLLGTSRNGGEQFDFKGKLRLDGKIGEDLLIIQIQTKEGDTDLPLSKIGIRFRAKPRPSLSVNKVVLEGYEGDDKFKGEFSLILVRQPTDTPLSIDQHRTEPGNIALQVLSSSESKPLEESDLVRDSMRIQLSLPSNKLDQLPGSISLAANGYDRLLNLPISLEKLSMFSVKPARLFLGIVKKDALIEKTVTIAHSNTGPQFFDQMSLLKTDIPVRLVESKIDGDKAIVKLEFQTNGESGRGATDVSLQFKDGSKINIPITWVMK